MRKAIAALTLAAGIALPATASAAGGEHACPSVHARPLVVSVFAEKMTTCKQADAVARYFISHEAVMPFRVAGHRWQVVSSSRGREFGVRVIGKPFDGAGYGVLLFTNLPVS